MIETVPFSVFFVGNSIIKLIRGMFRSQYLPELATILLG